jgi:beta-lactamase regulating signal transducer with metallopeptidase domain
MKSLLEIGLGNALLASGLAVLAAAAAQLCRRPALTHGLWLLVLLKLVTPPLVPLSISWPLFPEPEASEAQPPAARAEPGPVQAAEVPVPLPAAESPLPAEPPAVEKPGSGPMGAPASAAGPGLPSWVGIVAPLWLAGSLLWLVWLLLHVGRFQRLLRFAQPAPAELAAQVGDLARRLGLARPPSVWLVPGAVSPMLWTLGAAPRLLFPARLLERLDREQQTTLLVHELAHLRRRDHWVRFLELLVLCLYWWHPVVWWARRELHEAEEQCCDAWVVGTLAGAGRAYALALLQTVAFFSNVRSTLPVAASGIGQVPHLRRRLTMIMQGKTPRSLSWLGGLTVAGLGLLVLPLGAQEPRGREKPAPKTSRQEKIEILRKAIQILEEQERADQKKAPEKKKDARDAAAIDKARAELKAAEEVVVAKQGELRQALERHRAAAARLARLEGRDVRQFGRRAGAGEGLRAPENVIRPRFAREPEQGRRRGSGRAQDGRATELEQKLDRLLREVEELRRALGRQPMGMMGGGRMAGPRGPTGGMRPPLGPRAPRAPVQPRQPREPVQPRPNPAREKRDAAQPRPNPVREKAEAPKRPEPVKPNPSP